MKNMEIKTIAQVKSGSEDLSTPKPCTRKIAAGMKTIVAEFLCHFIATD